MRKYSHGIKSVEPESTVKAPRPKPKAELSMYWHDFERWDDILKSMAQTGIEARSGDFTKLRLYFESMWTIWAEWEQKMVEYDRDRNTEFESRFDKMDRAINSFIENFSAAKLQMSTTISIPFELIQDLRKLHRDILKMKEDLGLGVWSNRPPSEDDLMHKGI